MELKYRNYNEKKSTLQIFCFLKKYRYNHDMEINHLSQNAPTKEQERILHIVSSKINTILEHPTDNFCDEINIVLERMLNHSIKNIKQDNESQRKYFAHICHFMNSLFGNTHIKKFYNFSPKISFKDYNNMSL